MSIEYRGYVIERDKVHSLFHIHHSGPGTLPLSLTGLFTDERAYKTVIDAYIAGKELAEAKQKEAEEQARAIIEAQIKSDAVKFEELKKEAEEINRKRKGESKE